MFSPTDIDRFLKEAPEDKIQFKLVALIAIFGGLRRSEMINLTWGDFINNQDHLSVTVAKSKTDQASEGFTYFAKKHSDPQLCPVVAFERYKSCTNDPTGATRFIRQGSMKNRFTRQPRGRECILGLPK